MKILIFGGTGAMGTPLVNLLRKSNNELYVTSRSNNKSEGNIHYIKGNAHNLEFVQRILLEKYDAIVDFMVYSSDELKKRVTLYLTNTKQYIFLSSSRVYADSKCRISEESPRLLDVCKDEDYTSTDEYALAKAREEDILIGSGYNNWTIVRPYITYNSYRLQLGVYEKEQWLYRALNGRTIVFPKNIAEKTTTLTHGNDVAYAIAKLIGNTKAYGQVFHIATEQYATWMEILNIYLEVIEKNIGIRPKVKLIDNSNSLQKIWNAAQIKYDRLYDRKFDNSKINSVCGKVDYIDLREGIESSLKEFISDPKWINLNFRFEAWADKISKERTPLKEIKGKKMKLKYMKWRWFNK
ncbi:MAG: NAD-dependent epimerase/dehydratase family protein [Lachnospirales bacterium]